MFTIKVNVGDAGMALDKPQPEIAKGNRERVRLVFEGTGQWADIEHTSGFTVTFSDGTEVSAPYGKCFVPQAMFATNELEFTAKMGSLASANSVTIELSVIETGSGSGGGADWNAAEGEAGYIANRTHWATTSTETLVDNKTVSFTLNPVGQIYGSSSDMPQLTVGQTYTVEWDGEVYECVAYLPANTYDSVGLGNCSLGNMGDETQGNGEPFFVLCKTFNTNWDVFAKSASSHTFTVATTVSEFHKLDEGYIPDAIARIADLTGGLSVVTFTFDAANSRYTNCSHTFEQLGEMWSNSMPIVAVRTSYNDTGMWFDSLTRLEALAGDQLPPGTATDDIENFNFSWGDSTSALYYFRGEILHQEER